MAEALGVASAASTLFDLTLRIYKIIKDLTIERLKDVENFLQQFQTRSKLARAQWTNEKYVARRLLGDIRDARHQINTALVMANAKTNLHLSIDFQALRSQLFREYTLTRDSVSELKANLSTSRAAHGGQSEFVKADTAPRVISSTVGYAQSSKHNISQWQGRHDITPSLITGQRHGAFFRVPVKANRSNSLSCSTGCPCFCHQCTNMHVFGNSLTGQLLLSCLGLSRLFWDCSVKSCTTNLPSYEIEIEYYFPNWLIRKAISLDILFGHLHQPSISIRVSNVLSQDHEWFQAARSRNLEKLRAMVELCPSRINDVNEYGSTALWLVALVHSYECIDFLVTAGADITAGPASSALDLIFVSRILGLDKAWPLSIGESIFKETVEQLPQGHKIIIGASPQDLNSYLRENPHNLELRDENRRTPLWWAVILGKISQLKGLLRAGAALDTQDINGHTPLEIACWNQQAAHVQAKTIELMLTQKPDLTGRDVTGSTILHKACRVQDEKIRNKLMDQGIKQGVEVNYRNRGGTTPLLHTVEYLDEDDSSSLDVLVGAGADLDTDHSYDINILMVAIRKRKPRSLSFLLRKGADYLRKDGNGATILHWVAQSPYLPTLHTLIAHGIPSIDAHARDRWNRTALDIFNATDHDQLIREEFSTLIDNVVFGKQFGEVDSTETRAFTGISNDECRFHPVEDQSPDDGSSEYESALEEMDVETL